MRYSKDHKEHTRDRILAHASARFRKDGAAVGIRGLIGDAGLTHGAFYSHFASRSDLLAEAVRTALQTTRNYFEDKLAAAPADAALGLFAENYLSMAHRDAPETGCAGAALASEIAREDEATREAFTRGVDGLVAMIANILPPGGTERARSARARIIFAGMIGALQLARVADREEAERILEEARTDVVAISRVGWLSR